MEEITTNLMENISSLITFQLGGEMFCADMQNVVQIIDPDELDQEKDINSDGSNIDLGAIKIPMINLHKMAGIEPKKISKDNRILVINIDKNNFGFWVEKVDNIYTIGQDPNVEIEINGYEEILYVKGILKFKKLKMLLLDLKGLSLTNSKIA